MLTLMQHQVRAVEIGSERPRYGFFFDCGTGKTVSILAIIDELKHQGRRLKNLVVCPKSIMRTAWLGDAQHFPDLRVVICWDSSASQRRKLIATPNADVLIINPALFKTHAADFLAAGVRRLVVDECFIAGTPVDTPTGVLPIESIRPGDKVLCAAGWGTVEEVSKKRIRKLVRITTTTGTFVCSENHLFFMLDGWKRSSIIKKGDFLYGTKKAMQLVQGKRSHTLHWNKKNEAFLRNILLREMANVQSCIQEIDLHRCQTAKNNRKNQGLVGQRKPDIYSWEKKNRCNEAHVNSYGSGEGIKTLAGNWASSSDTRRKWKTNAGPTEKTPFHAPKNRSTMGWGTSRVCWGSKKRLSNLLQNRHRTQREKNQHRGRWFFACGGKKKRTGQKENSFFGIARVESVEILEPRSPQFTRYSDGKDFVYCYDLKINEHPSFSVHGCLVHNSSCLKNHKAQITKAAIAFSDMMESVYLLSGTPAPNDGTEYWGQLRCIKRGLVPDSFWNFAGRYFYPQKRVINGRDVTVGWTMRETERERFNLLLRSASWALRKEDCLDLPQQIDVVREFDLSHEEEAVYKATAEQMVREVETGAGPIDVATNNTLMRLRQIVGGQIKDQWPFGQSKLDELKDVLAEIGNHQVVIWASFTHEINRITAETGASVIDGSVPLHTREERINSFQAGQIRYLVCQPQAAGHGITLTAASYAIYYSLPMGSWELVKQSRDRLHRVGQSHPCTYIYLLGKDTCEVKNYWAIKHKKSNAELMAAILSQAKGIAEPVLS